jgi:hypothetical protein
MRLNTYTVLEVNGRDRPGLLHDVTAAISDQGLQIASAHVTTYGVRAVDVFYVKDVFGLKVENERKLALLREAPTDEQCCGSAVKRFHLPTAIASSSSGPVAQDRVMARDRLPATFRCRSARQRKHHRASSPIRNAIG